MNKNFDVVSVNLEDDSNTVTPLANVPNLEERLQQPTMLDNFFSRTHTERREIAKSLGLHTPAHKLKFNEWITKISRSSQAGAQIARQNKQKQKNDQNRVHEEKIHARYQELIVLHGEEEANRIIELEVTRNDELDYKRYLELSSRKSFKKRKKGKRNKRMSNNR